MSLQCVTFPSGPLRCNSAKKQRLVIYKDLLSFPQAHPRSCTSVRLRLGLEDVAQIAHNKVLIAAGVSAAIGQLSKPFTSSIFYGKIFDFKTAVQAGGFPSTHSSAVVATATSLGLERGFTDSIFGMTVVYACLVMYDAQGVRREVGNHARTLNGILLPKTKVNSISSKEMDDLLDSKPARSSSLDSESLGPLLSEETISSHTPKPAPLLVRSANGARQVLMSSGVEEGSENATRSPTTLKEAIGHTEVEVIAGAQGAQPKGSLTATTYESVGGGQNKTKTDIRSKEDEGGIEVDKLQDKVEDAAGKGGPVFGAGKDEKKQDLGVTGTA